MLVANPHSQDLPQAVEHHAVEPPVARQAVLGHSAPAMEVVEIDSTDLLQGQRELHIRHGNECYRLRHTRNDKLILTK